MRPGSTLANGTCHTSVLFRSQLLKCCSYIHGIMDGEAAVKATEDKTDFAEYRIV